MADAAIGRRAPIARAAMPLEEIRRYGRTTTSQAPSHSAISRSETYSSFQRTSSRAGLASHRFRTSAMSGKTSPTMAIRALDRAAIVRRRLEQQLDPLVAAHEAEEEHERPVREAELSPRFLAGSGGLLGRDRGQLDEEDGRAGEQAPELLAVLFRVRRRRRPRRRGRPGSGIVAARRSRGRRGCDRASPSAGRERGAPAAGRELARAGPRTTSTRERARRQAPRRRFLRRLAPRERREVVEKRPCGRRPAAAGPRRSAADRATSGRAANTSGSRRAQLRERLGQASGLVRDAAPVGRRRAERAWVANSLQALTAGATGPSGTPPPGSRARRGGRRRRPGARREGTLRRLAARREDDLLEEVRGDEARARARQQPPVRRRRATSPGG